MLFDFGAKAGALHAAGVAGALNHCAYLGRVMAEGRGHAQHAFAADLANLERHAPFGDAQQAHQAIVREIDVLDRVAGLA